jgi:hypothetical protein
MGAICRTPKFSRCQAFDFGGSFSSLVTDSAEHCGAMTPQELQNLPDDLEPFRAQTKRAWKNLAENTWGSFAECPDYDAGGAEFPWLLERPGDVRAQLPHLW